MKSRDNAEVSVGVLIVFIAMVLVAAVAAAVLINTVASMQPQEEDRVQESSEDVDNSTNATPRAHAPRSRTLELEPRSLR